METAFRKMELCTQPTLDVVIRASSGMSALALPGQLVPEAIANHEHACDAKAVPMIGIVWLAWASGD